MSTTDQQGGLATGGGFAPTLQRVEQRTTSDAATHVLRQAILSGYFGPGTQLRENQISAEMGVSRASLREALGRLIDEGLVEKVPFRGAFVARVEPKVIDEIAALRVQLEPYAILQSLEHGGADFLAELSSRVETLARVADEGDMQATIDAHLAVHRLLYTWSNNTLLADMWSDWESRLKLFLAIDHRSFMALHEVGEAHRRFLSAVETRSPSIITREVKGHVHGSAPLRP